MNVFPRGRQTAIPFTGERATDVPVRPHRKISVCALGKKVFKDADVGMANKMASASLKFGKPRIGDNNSASPSRADVA